jgi:diketogulonate reductase-like aldo/keto reductase
MSNSTNQTNSIDPAQIPSLPLSTGAKIPGLGLGTFGSDKYAAAEIAAAVRDAVAFGYRHIDCASVYGNEKEIGGAIKSIVNEDGIKREELWITSKVWNDKHGEGQVIASAKQSLSDLGLDYLDLFLVHWPFPNHHASGVDVSSRDPHARPYIHEEFLVAWRQMEQLYDEGLVRHIGVSNVTIPKLELILRDVKIKPHACELELHPHFQQPALFKFLKEQQIIPIGYSPIGSPSRPERDRTPDDTVDIEDPVIVQIAQRLGVHPAVVCVKWSMGIGAVPIPFSVKPSQYRSTLQAASDAALTASDLKAISKIDKNNRLIKGQVFLWEGTKDWHALWDENGAIEK